jgi:peptidyl-prolyl cis-trans isomerase D
MLDLMRRKAQSPYLQATVLIIILVFIFWGVGGNQGNAPNVVATVNDTPISYQEYEKTYDQVIDQYRQQFGGSIPEALLKTLNIKDQVVQKLVDRILILQEANKVGIHISDQEVRDYIEAIPSFQVNGVFNVNTYRDLLAASRMTVAGFEAGVRSDLLTKKVVSALSKFGIASEYDLQARFNYENEELKLKYAKFEADSFKNQVAITEEALQKYYDEHKTDYQTAEKRKLKYLTFLTSDVANVEPSEEEIEAHYQQNLAAYSQPEKRRARHILIKTSAADTAEDKAAKRQRAEEILAQARKGDDFAGLATIYSEDGSASKGGDLGFFSRGKMVKPFEEAVFAMQEGEISDIVETQFGYHVIKLEKISPASVKPLEEVRGDIVARLQEQKSRSNAAAAANAAYEQIILAGSLDKYAATSSKTLQEVGFFEKQNPPDSVVGEAAFLNAAFSLGKGELSSLVEIPDGYAIIYVEDIKAPEVPPFEIVRERVEKDFREARAREMAAGKAGEMFAAVRKGEDFASVAKEYGVSVEESVYFSRQNRYGTNLPMALVEDALELSLESPYPDETISEANATYVFRLADIKPTDEAAFSEKREQYEQQLQSENTSELLTAWLDGLRKKAEITRNEQLL